MIIGMENPYDSNSGTKKLIRDNTKKVRTQILQPTRHFEKKCFMSEKN